MPAKYIIRLDDASEFMDFKKWNKFFEIFDEFNIYPIIAVIPFNKDPKLINDNPVSDFWEIVKKWQKKKYIIALHGFQHLYSNFDGGILSINKYSEFATVELETQNEMIKKGIKKFNEEGISTNMFVAPAHSFDHNTLKALTNNKIEYISDGFFIKGIKRNGINWIPQQLWFPQKKKKGLWTICAHPETCDNLYIDNLRKFIMNEKDNFVNPLELEFNDYFSILDFFLNIYILNKFRILNRLIRIRNYISKFY